MTAVIINENSFKILMNNLKYTTKLETLYLIGRNWILILDNQIRDQYWDISTSNFKYITMLKNLAICSKTVGWFH